VKKSIEYLFAHLHQLFVHPKCCRAGTFHFLLLLRFWFCFRLLFLLFSLLGFRKSQRLWKRKMGLSGIDELLVSLWGLGYLTTSLTLRFLKAKRKEQQSKIPIDLQADTLHLLPQLLASSAISCRAFSTIAGSLLAVFANSGFFWKCRRGSAMRT